MSNPLASLIKCHRPTNSSAASPIKPAHLISARPFNVKARAEHQPRSVNQPTACLSGAAIIHDGNDAIYAFGGSDEYTTEVFNHVLRLSLANKEWSMVDNYGDIPDVRTGHTANLWHGDKVLVFGGENEHRSYWNDLIIFDIQTARWHRPELTGPSPQGRAHHSAVVHDEKLFIIGGVSGHDNKTVLDNFCYLDLERWVWSSTWHFVPRYGHCSWAHGDRIWVSGGFSQDLHHMDDIWSFYVGQIQELSSLGGLEQSRPDLRLPQSPPSSDPNTNATIQTNVSQNEKTYFQTFSPSGILNIAISSPEETAGSSISVSSLDLESMHWEKFAEGKDIFDTKYRWQYCVMNPAGTETWLLGGSAEPLVSRDGDGDYLSDVLHIDLANLGILVNAAS